MAQNSQALVYAPEALKGDREIVLAAVAQTGVALEFASVELKAEYELVRPHLGSAEYGPVARVLFALGLAKHLPAMMYQELTAALLPALPDAQLKELGGGFLGFGYPKWELAERLTFLQAVRPQQPAAQAPVATAQAKFAAFFQRMGNTSSLQGLEAVPVSSLREAVTFIAGDGAPS